MSQTPRNLPGFYYDNERKRYFPLTGATQQRLKRQTLETKKEDEQTKNWEYLVNQYTKFMINPLQKTELDNPTLQMMQAFIKMGDEGGGEKTILEINHLDATNGKPRVHILDVLSFINGFVQFLFLSDGTIVKYEKCKNQTHWNRTECPFSPKTTMNLGYNKISIIKLLSGSNSLCLHYKAEKNNNLNAVNPEELLISEGVSLHSFVEVDLPFSNPLEDAKTIKNPITKRRNFDFLLNFGRQEDKLKPITDCGKLSNGYVMSSGSNILISWDIGTGIIVKISAGSDIVALDMTLNKYDGDSLYCGCRNGFLYMIIFEETKRRIKSKKCIKNLCDISSIISLKSSTKDKIIISAIRKNMNSQFLFLWDPLLENSNDRNNPPITQFMTRFMNVTKETEILRLSKDNKFVLYGKKGTNDFELFSINTSVHQLGHGVACHPVATLSDYITTKDINLSKYKLKNIHFTHNTCAPASDLENTPNLYDFISITFESVVDLKLLDSTLPSLKIINFPIA